MANFTDFTAGSSISSGDYLEGHLASEGTGSERKFTALAVGQGVFEHAGQYAELVHESNVAATTFSATSTNWGNKVQLDFLYASSVEQGLDADNAQNHILTGTTGIYLANVSLSFSGGPSDTISFSLWINNGGTQVSGRATQKLDASGNTANVALATCVSLTAGDTLELWAQNETSTSSITVEDVIMTAVRVG